MRRVLAIVLLLALAGCTASSPAHRAGDAATEGAAAAPPPPPPPTADAIRLAVGDTWTYAVTSPRGNSTETARVTQVTDAAAIVETDGPRPLRTELDRATLAIRSVAQSSGTVQGSVTFDPPLPTVIPAADHEWIGTLTIRSPLGASAQPARANVTLLGLERVTVPAGTFECYHYLLDVSSQGQPSFRQHLDVWFASAVKTYVKQASGNQTQELLSYHVA